MTTHQAAAALGVSVRQIQRLVERSHLTAVGQVGRVFLLDARQVQRVAAVGIARGRPWSELTCWAALDLLDTGSTHLLGTAVRGRLRARMVAMTVDALVSSLRHRATSATYRGAGSFLEPISQVLELTGTSALVVGDRARRFGLANVVGATVDGYTNDETRRQLVETFALVGDPGGNITMRVRKRRDHDAGPRVDQSCSDAVVAIDLAESLDPRLAAAGRRILGDRLQALDGNDDGDGDSATLRR